MQQLAINRKNFEIEFNVSEHAGLRMNQRSIARKALKTVLTYGRIIRSRGACFYVLGKRDLSHLQKAGVRVQSLENTQVVVDEKSNTVLTVYKNNNFRKIRPFRRRERKLQ